mmetsp:Transcript_18313/g.54659  ORF Transcript_18313/g.54659 Transcript_18313/m.54659 type:complete len:351 (-) Transcript_18313:267-1319(-)
MAAAGRAALSDSATVCGTAGDTSASSPCTRCAMVLAAIAAVDGFLETGSGGEAGVPCFAASPPLPACLPAPGYAAAPSTPLFPFSLTLVLPLTLRSTPPSTLGAFASDGRSHASRSLRRSATMARQRAPTPRTRRSRHALVDASRHWLPMRRARLLSSSFPSADLWSAGNCSSLGFFDSETMLPASAPSTLVAATLVAATLSGRCTGAYVPSPSPPASLIDIADMAAAAAAAAAVAAAAAALAACTAAAAALRRDWTDLECCDDPTEWPPSPFPGAGCTGSGAVAGASAPSGRSLSCTSVASATSSPAASPPPPPAGSPTAASLCACALCVGAAPPFDVGSIEFDVGSIE